MTDDELVVAIQTEYARLGLDWERAPVEVVNATTEDEPNADRSDDLFLAHLRRLEPGATWRDVFDLPAHWDLDDPQTWSVPYHPLGPLDHQVLPTGPALLLAWPATLDDGCLDRLCARATAAAFHVHAAWFVPLSRPFSERLAYVVLPHDTTAAILAAFQAFVDADVEARVWAVHRTGRERYQA
jgi:hypothetical protein